MHLVPIAALLITLPAAAQQVPSYNHVSTPHTTAPERKVELPVTRVSLYKNGVGFFEHTGFVHGDAKVTIDFTSAQLNDVLQSLTAIDLNGGRISGAGYNSTTPLDQQLRSLSLGIGLNTNYAQFLNAVRGSRVEIRGSGAPFTGRLLDIEQHPTTPADKSGGMTDTAYLSVISDSGEARIFPLTPALSVRVLDAPLHADVNRYLSLLDSTRNQGLRHLTLDDRGNGARELRVSYISEVPVWKSTYRILFTESPKPDAPTQTATLQGWSVIDNTTGVDWINVHLSLIAGAPQSFIQPLSQPIYSRRPEISIATQAQLSPQTFDSGIEGKQSDRLEQYANLMTPPPPPPPPPAMPAMRGRAIGAGTGMSGSMGGPLTLNGAMTGESSYQEAAAATLSVNTNTSTFDDFFSYNIADPVTIRTNESALVPILQSKVAVDRVTLVTSNGNYVAQPLRALWLTNTTGLTLDRGSFSIVENGAFGGEGLLDPIHAGEKRLLSYAADQAVHVSTENPFTTKRVDHITGSKGIIRLHSADIREVTYLIHNAAAEPRTVVLEHPKFNGYKIEGTAADGSPVTQPTESTDNVYRFREVVAPGATQKLLVSERHRGVTTIRLTDAKEDQFKLIVKESAEDPSIQAALQPILDARRRVADAQTAANQTRSTLDNLRKDEDRQRANIAALNSVDKTSRDRFVKDLNHTEDQIAAAQTELATRVNALEAAKADLANRIDSVNLDLKVTPK